MKRLIVALALAASLGMAGNALALDKKINIFNGAQYDIYTLYLSPTNANDWEENLLKQETLPNGDKVDIEVSRTEKAEAWDVKVMGVCSSGVVNRALSPSFSSTCRSASRFIAVTATNSASGSLATTLSSAVGGMPLAASISAPRSASKSSPGTSIVRGSSSSTVTGASPAGSSESAGTEKECPSNES